MVENYLQSGGHVTFVDTGVSSSIALDLTNKYPDNVNSSSAEDICTAVYGDPVIPISGKTDGIRVKKNVINGADLYFIHNRTPDMKNFNIELKGDFTLCSMDMDVS